jgi:dephospho-CoA kinase
MMLRIGLTGSIATGKSTVLEAFADFGAPVFSADEAVHDLYQGEAVRPVGAAFPGVIKDGKIDRAALSAVLVAQPERLKALETIVHPLVRQKISAFFDAAAKTGAGLAVVEIPLLLEGGHDYGVDAVAVTVCDPEIQRKRALARPGMTVEKLETILARQMPQDEKKQHATYVFDTGGTIAATRNMVKALVDAIAAAGSGSS